MPFMNGPVIHDGNILCIWGMCVLVILRL